MPSVHIRNELIHLVPVYEAHDAAGRISINNVLYIHQLGVLAVSNVLQVLVKVQVRHSCQLLELSNVQVCAFLSGLFRNKEGNLLHSTGYKVISCTKFSCLNCVLCSKTFMEFHGKVLPEDRHSRAKL